MNYSQTYTSINKYIFLKSRSVGIEAQLQFVKLTTGPIAFLGSGLKPRSNLLFGLLTLIQKWLKITGPDPSMCSVGRQAMLGLPCRNSGLLVN